MLRMKDVPPDQMAEVVRVAGELYDAEQAQAQERRATVAAASEMGLPKVYLDRAAELVHARRVEQIGRQRRRRVGLMAGLGVAVAIGGGWFVTHPRPAAPRAYSFQPAQWNQESDPASKAAVTFANGAATIHVDHFGTSAGADQFFVNLNTKDVPRTLSGYRTVSFRAQSAGLPSLRLYLENPDERWRSADLSVPSGGQVFRLDLSQFDHQTRDASTGRWQKVGASAPGHVEQLSFKVGYYVNNADAHGDVQVSDLRFQ